MTATITVEIDSKKDVWAIPSDFITSFGAGRNIVTIIDNTPKNQNTDSKQEGNAQKPQNKKEKNSNFIVKEVQTGISDGKWTEIISGLEKEDTVVILGIKKDSKQRQPGGMRIR